MATTERSTAVGIFEDRDRAERAVEELGRAGFGHDQIGLAVRGGEAPREGTHPGTSEAMDLAGETGSQASREFTGALTGTAAGGLLGAAAALLVPGIGPVLAGGLLAGALGGAAVGAAAGGLLGALTGLGVSEEEARYYDQEFQAGRTIVTVKADGRYQEAVEILRRSGAYDSGSRRAAGPNISS